MKVCFFGLENLPVLAREFNQHGIGGEQVQQTLLAKALTRRGHDTCMVVADYGQEDGAVWDNVRTFKAYNPTDGIPIFRYIHPRGTGIWSALKRADADIYYTSCAGMHLGLLAMFCKRYRRRLVFRVAHDRDCEPDNLLIKYWRDKKLYEYGLKNCDAILVQSLKQQQAICINYGMQSVVAEMPVDPSEAEVTFPHRYIDVLWVNNIRQFKRPDLFIELARCLPAVSFHMVGGPQPGFAHLYDHIEQECASLSNVSFHGRVPYHDIGPMYAHAKVFVNTSDSEGFPNSFLQSWIRGTPVVSFFDPDSVIARERLGVAATSIKEMASTVQCLTANANEWKKMSDQCRAYISATYNEDRILQPYIEMLFKEVA
jgi:glycosyltransferase involved in cell wall biosynthesis